MQHNTEELHGTQWAKTNCCIHTRRLNRLNETVLASKHKKWFQWTNYTLYPINFHRFQFDLFITQKSFRLISLFSHTSDVAIGRWPQNNCTNLIKVSITLNAFNIHVKITHKSLRFRFIKFESITEYRRRQRQQLQQQQWKQQPI